MTGERGLGISIVVYHSDAAALRAGLESLRNALSHTCRAGLLDHATVWLIDNGSDHPAELDRLAIEALAPGDRWLRLEVLRGHGNVGYGSGHDLALSRAGATWHLVLNPDVVMHPDAISEGIGYLRDHPEVALVTPHAVDAEGRRQFLCKRYPSLLVLGLRGFAPERLRRWFRSLLDRYEMRDMHEHEVATGIPIASGCFMLARAEVLRAIGGFSTRYFLYFEDFDLSLRLGRIADIAYVPAVHIVHGGGDAARKGRLHQRLFLRSAITFFRSHGWKLW
jgi:GT2 family glycosyltransferase